MEFKNYTATKNKEGNIYLENNNLAGIHTGNKAVLLPEIVSTPQKSVQNIIKDMRDNNKFNNPYATDKPLSGADPIGQFIVEGAALNPVFKLAGKAVLYGAGRLGSNYAKAKIISSAMDNSILNKISPSNIIEKSIDNTLKNTDSPYLGLLQKNPKLSLQERLGVPKEIRNRIYKPNPNAGVESNVDAYLINRSNTPYDFSEGDMRWKTGNSRGSTNSNIRTTSHFTTDQPVIAHGAGNWDSSSETLIIPYKQMVKSAGNPVSIEPMDTYFTSPNSLTVNKEGAKILTGDKRNYLKYKGQGVNAEYSKESENLVNQIRIKKDEYGRLSKELMENDFNKDVSENKQNIYNQISDLMDQNRKIHYDWVKKHGQPSSDTYNKMSKETQTYNPMIERDLYSNQFIPNKNIGYQTQPSTHSDSWLGTAEHDAKKGVNQFIKQIQKGENIQKENLPTFQYYFNKLGIKPTYRLPETAQNSDIINRILSGERVFKYKDGGLL